jgi:hypothetical protein
MADYGAAISWGDPKTGREKKSLDLFGEVMTLNEQAVGDGRIESWDVVLFEPVGSPPTGTMRVYGTAEQIEAFVASTEFTGSLQRASLLLDHVGVRRFRTGNALMEGVGQYSALIDSL